MRRPESRKKPVHVPRNVLLGGTGGLLAGALIGLAEALWLAATAGAPDLVAPLYAVVLYGLIGLPIGIGGGLVLAAWEKVRGGTGDGVAWAFGFASAAAPMLLAILYYLANKVVYLERGVPLTGKVAVLAIAGAVAVGALLVLPRLIEGPLKVMQRGKGLLLAWGGLIAVTGAVAVLLAPPGPRWAHDDPVPPALEDAPNVLFVMVDTLRADHLGAYGGADSPAIDRLAEEGVLFEEAYAQASWTRSSGASLFTSRLPSSHGADTKAAVLSPEVVTWAEVLQGAGMTTGALINNINMTSSFGFDQGFDTFHYEAPAYPFGATESVFGLALYKVVHKVSERLLGGSKQVERYYQPADVVLADARAFVEANQEGRWALFVHLMEPHDPYFEHPVIAGTGQAEYNGVGFARAEVEHPDPSQADYLKRVYRDEVVFLDRKVAPFFDWLRETGEWDETVVVLTSDHGEEFFEHGGWWHGTTLYDEQIHVPLILKPAGGELAGTRVPWQVRLVDVAPTLAAAIGQDPDPSWQGRDLLGDVRAEAARAEAPGTVVATDAGEAAEPVADPAPVRGHPLDRVVVAEEDFEGNILAAIRTGGFKYLRANPDNPRGLPPELLFDVARDPGEEHDLLGTGRAVGGIYPADRAEALAEQLRQVISQAGASAAEGGTVTMSAAECERLKALGYLGGDEACQ